jgi:hypothetical protein
MRAGAAGRALLLAAAMASTATMVPAHAGRTCEEHVLTATSLGHALDTGQRLQAALDATGSDVALIAREGQDLSKYQLKYSHAGLALRAAPGQPWRVYELLNDCGTADSALWVDGLANFFLDDPFTLDALVMVPPPAVAAKLTQALGDTTGLHRLHGVRYNMVAYPFSSKYQNSNQWVLEVLAYASAGAGQVRTRDEAQAWLKAAGYQATEMRIGTLTRLGGRMFKANVAFDDHPGPLRYAGRINVVTVDSMQTFLAQRQGWTMQEIKK